MENRRHELIYVFFPPARNQTLRGLEHISTRHKPYEPKFRQAKRGRANRSDSDTNPTCKYKGTNNTQTISSYHIQTLSPRYQAKVWSSFGFRRPGPHQRYSTAKVPMQTHPYHRGTPERTQENQKTAEDENNKNVGGGWRKKGSIAYTENRTQCSPQHIKFLYRFFACGSCQ